MEKKNGSLVHGLDTFQQKVVEGDALQGRLRLRLLLESPRGLFACFHFMRRLDSVQDGPSYLRSMQFLLRP
eukprot:3665980-Amphidinium_carterae.1